MSKADELAIERLEEFRKRFDAVGARQGRSPMTDEKWNARLSMSNSAAQFAGASPFACIEGALDKLEKMVPECH